MPECDGICMVNMDFLRDLDVFNEWMNDADYRVGNQTEQMAILDDKELLKGQLSKQNFRAFYGE